MQEEISVEDLMSVPSSLEQTKVEIAGAEWPTSVKPWSRPNEENLDPEEAR